MTGVTLNPLAPKDAIAFFRSKGLEPSFAWQDVWQEEHAKAFTVAKMMQTELLETTRGIVDQALSEGWTYEQFQKELAPRLKAAGWWGKQLQGDPATGEVKLVQLGSDRRLRTIFNTNMRTAYQHGNWQRAWRTRDSLPFMEFRHNSHLFPRPEHVAWDGTILPIEDAWWDTHYPPCGWGCKCTTRSLSQAMLTSRGLKVTTSPPRFQPVVYTNPRTGEISQIEKGIQPGWNYNVGKAPLRAITASPAAMPKGGAPLPQPAPEILKPAVDEFLKTLGATSPRIVKRDDWPLAIGPDLFKDAEGALATPRPDLIDYLALAARALVNYSRVEVFWRENAAGKQVLVRRYSKTLDNVLITVDFSEGTWTYDVQPAPVAAASLMAA